MISIIIPVFNRRNDLQRCLRSISAYGQDRVEVIVVDDHSSERLDDLCSDKVMFIRNTMNLGPSYSRNLASLHANGDILLFLDSDTELLPQTMLTMERILKDNQDIACVGGVGPANADGHDVEFVKTKYYDRFGRNQSLLRTEDDFPASGCIDCDHFESASMAIRADRFFEIGGFDPYWFYMGEDRDLCLRLRRAGHRVTVCWQARAIHHDRGLTGKQLASFQSFLVKRFLEVAYKCDGVVGAFRWLISNHIDFRHLLPIRPILLFFRLHQLRARRGQNFLDANAMGRYVAYLRKQKSLR